MKKTNKILLFFLIVGDLKLINIIIINAIRNVEEVICERMTLPDYKHD